MAVVTCPYRTPSCGLSVPCSRCREATSKRNGARVGYKRSFGGQSYWSRQSRG